MTEIEFEKRVNSLSEEEKKSFFEILENCYQLMAEAETMYKTALLNLKQLTNGTSTSND